ncbi:MAG: RNA polymerase sigma factor [Verrucomicrobiota bacterium]
MNPPPLAIAPADRQAFAALARDHHRCLLIYARALARNEATAADLVQDAFIAAWRNLGRFDVTRDFGAWLRGIIRNKWREYLRRHAREVDVDDATLEAWESRFAQWDANRGSGGVDLLESLDECLKHLPDAMSQAVQRFYYLEEPGESIAIALGIDTATFRKRLERARHALRSCLDRKLPTPA